MLRKLIKHLCNALKRPLFAFPWPPTTVPYSEEFCHAPIRRIKIPRMDKVRAHAYVSGMVQGVFFRATTVEEAQRIGDLTGWVRNLPDGRVEVVCEGPKEKVERLVAWLWHGPPSSHVNDVNVTWSSSTGEYHDFQIAYGRT